VCSVRAGFEPAAYDEHFEEMMMLGKRMNVAAMMVAMLCSSVSVALADGGTIKGVANENSTVRDIFVYVKSGLPAGKTWTVPTEPVVLDQKGCHYEPHVFGIMTGQELLVRNSDNTAHNINANPKNNDGFNQGQPKKGMEFTKTFGVAEQMVKFKCDVHPWMSAYCAVMEHPFFATTDEDGNFEITGLPDGTYVLSTWGERFKKGQEMTVTISGGETQEVEFVFQRPKNKKKG
jgi:plastocyanin